MEEKKSFLGTGWGFPVSFDEEMKTVTLVSEEEDIIQSLGLLLNTTPGERITKPEYGCDLESYIYKPISSETEFLMKETIRNAIFRFEPRIKIEDIEIDTTHKLDGIVNIRLYYLIRKVNVRTNIVYPFYFDEGTEIVEI
ncbi:MAG: GPW/gp25 family protein [Bacteroidia bacterium]|nr:GPW/gp25 family protein [Bacteroidia bacterium]